MGDRFVNFIKSKSNHIQSNNALYLFVRVNIYIIEPSISIINNTLTLHLTRLEMFNFINSEK